ncbi:MAG: hypothetical protein ACP5N2_01480 [Candidatus Nanoarchaeia archaeon]
MAYKKTAKAKQSESPQNRHEKSEKKAKSKRKETPNWFLLFFKYLGIGIWWVFKGLWWIVKQIGRGIWWISEGVVSLVSREKRVKVKKKKTSEIPQRIKVTTTIEGSFKNFWKRLKESDSLIGIVVGARGSGKSAVALCIMEELQGNKENYYAMGFKSKDIPNWINVVEDIKEIENNSFVIIDEGGILFSSRESMSDSNKFLSELLFIARHKDLSILFISQNSSNIEVNTLRQADFLILKKSSLLQKDFERKKISDIYTKYSEEFNKYKNTKKASLIYSDEFVGFVQSELPTFWSTKVSKGFRDK